MIRKKIASAVAAVSMAAGPGFVLAQQLEEVVVTARKKAESLMDAPLSVSVISIKLSGISCRFPSRR